MQTIYFLDDICPKLKHRKNFDEMLRGLGLITLNFLVDENVYEYAFCFR